MLVWFTLPIMIFAVFDPSPLTVCIDCGFCTFIEGKFERLAVGNDFEGDSRLWELRLFDRPYYHFLLVVCNNNYCLWHCFRDITTFTVYIRD